MNDELQKYLQTALDKNVGTYFRKDAIRRLGRSRYNDELAIAILDLLQNVEEPSLQRDVMDLTAQFAITEASEFLKPISLQKGQNARHAIMTLAKIGGIDAYRSLEEIASAPGFDLSKTAAKHALEDLLRRNPKLATKNSENEKISSVKTNFNKEKTNNHNTEALHNVTDNEEVDRLKRDLHELHNRYQNLETQIEQKNVKITELEDKIRHIKNQQNGGEELKETKKDLYEARQENLLAKSAYEKQILILQGKINNLEDETQELQKRLNNGQNTAKKSSGCFTKLIFGAIIFYVLYKIFISAADSNEDLRKIKENIEYERQIILDKLNNR